MPLLSKDPALILAHRYLFSGTTVLVGTDGRALPDDAIIRKCLEQQLAHDWFSEPAFDYTTLLLETDSPAPKGYEWLPLRAYFASAAADAPLAARAMGLLNWRRATRFCSNCGGSLHDSKEETARICLVCGKLYFPRIEPAIIVVVEKDDTILLARHVQRNTDVYTCIAGFVELGETIEDCVRREVREETGIVVKNVRYVGSQSWPFPNQLMLAFRADWASGVPTPDKSELSDIQWFSRDKLPQIPLPGGVAYRLIMNQLQ